MMDLEEMFISGACCIRSAWRINENLNHYTADKPAGQRPAFRHEIITKI